MAQWFMVALVRNPVFESHSCRFFAIPLSISAGWIPINIHRNFGYWLKTGHENFIATLFTNLMRVLQLSTPLTKGHDQSTSLNSSVINTRSQGTIRLILQDIRVCMYVQVIQYLSKIIRLIFIHL